MKDFSDPGYGYLGELLASRGFILVSVDENFINGNLRGENDGRGWLLLEHLERWRAWNDSSGSPFYHKVDMGNIALMGHSRGGEAVAVAAAFNRLSHYPDDATIKFNFNFDIKSIVAIAPVDGQYQPAGKPTPLENVNYLVFHGSHDGDVSAFSGLRQYQRIRFTDGKPWFKSAVYMYRANHGQWNTVWGNKDNGPRSGRWLELDALISAGRAAPVRQGVHRRLPRGDAQGQEGIPADVPRSSHDRPVAAEDDVHHALLGERLQARSPASTKTSMSRPAPSPASRSPADSLSGWKEAPIPIRSRNSDLGTNAVWLGWNNKPAGKDTTKPRAPASYSVTINDSLRSAWNVGEGSSVVLSLAPTPATPGPRKTARDTTKKADSSGSQGQTGREAGQEEADAEEGTRPIRRRSISPWSWSTRRAATARVALSQFGKPRRPLEITVYRRKNRDKNGVPESVRAGAADVRDAGQGIHARLRAASMPHE